MECYQAQDYHGAVENLREAVRLDPTKIAYHKLLGQALAKNPKWRQQAETHLRRVIDAEPYDQDCYLALAAIYEQSGMSMRARKMYEKVACLDPDHEVALKKLASRARRRRRRFFASSSEIGRRSHGLPSTVRPAQPPPAFLATLPARMPAYRHHGEPERDPEATFQRLDDDDDGDGNLSRDELSMIARTHLRPARSSGVESCSDRSLHGGAGRAIAGVEIGTCRRLVELVPAQEDGSESGQATVYIHEEDDHEEGTSVR